MSPEQDVKRHRGCESSYQFIPMMTRILDGPIGQVMTMAPDIQIHDINNDYRQQIHEMVTHYEQRIHKIQPAKGIQCPINTEGSPVKQKPYRRSIYKQQKADEIIQELLNQDIIEHSRSPWASPILLVPKKTGEFRMCIDYRELNKQTVADAHPLPNLQDIITKIGVTRPIVFTVIDLKGGFHQLEISKEDRHKTAFITQDGLYQYKRLPFGLKNAPSQFQRYLQRILQEHIRQGYVLVYIDDIIIFSPTTQQHLQHLQAVLDTLAESNINFRRDKCTFMATKVNYLGHEFSKEGITPNKHNLKAIERLRPPTSLTELQALLGLLNYYASFIPDRALRMINMLTLLKKNTPFIWTSRMTTELEETKTFLLQQPLLAFPDTTKPYILYTDASAYAIGWILLQEQHQQTVIIRMGARTLTKTEQKASTIDRELIAILTAIKTTSYLIEGHETTLYTDHRPLTAALKDIPCNPRNARIITVILRYKLQIKYCPGKLNLVADALSRLTADKPIIITATQQEQPVTNLTNSGLVALPTIQATPIEYGTVITLPNRINVPYWRIPGYQQQQVTDDLIMCDIIISIANYQDIYYLPEMMKYGKG